MGLVPADGFVTVAVKVVKFVPSSSTFIVAVASPFIWKVEAEGEAVLFASPVLIAGKVITISSPVSRF